MKNLVVFLVVFMVFLLAVPAMAQRATSPYSSIFGRKQQTDAGIAADTIGEQDENDFRDLAREEIRQTFSDKSFTVVETEEESATFTIEVKIFSRNRIGNYSDRYYQYSYHREPEAIVFVTVRDRPSGVVMVVGEGKNKNLHRAIEKAAGSAADKLKKKRADRTIFLP